MTNPTTSVDANEPTRLKKSFFQTLELDVRMLGMVGAFVVIGLAFQLWTGFRVAHGANPWAWLVNGTYVTPRNLFNLTIQTASVGIMATGMVFVIVMRHIDLSVGAVLAVTSAMMAMTQVLVLPQWLGVPLGSPLIAPVAIVIGLIAGVAVGALHGALIGYLAIPAFIVTLGGYLIWRNVAWYLTTGQTIGPLDQTFQIFGGTNGTLGEMGSWVFGALAAAATIWAMSRARALKAAHEFPVKPFWAEVLLGGLVTVLILGFVWVLNSYEVPAARLARDFAARGETMPEGYTEGYGIPISVLLLILVAVIMTVVAKRTRLGRYIFAAGGNPEAAALAGINIRFLTVKLFMIMGALAAISAVVASSRQTFHSNDIGTLDELRVIAAAVIGGTAFAGGIGTIHGAILGALIMQSLQSGMAMVGVDAPFQNIVVGMVLIIAVLIDTFYRKRTGA